MEQSERGGQVEGRCAQDDKLELFCFYNNVLIYFPRCHFFAVTSVVVGWGSNFPPVLLKMVSTIECFPGYLQ